MEWVLMFVLIIGGLMLFMALGFPLIFAFLCISVIGVHLLQGGGSAMIQLILSTVTSVQTFGLVPIPLFIFMGSLLFHTNLGQQALDAIEKWVGRLPGRLSIVSLLAGGLFSALSGSSVANAAMLGTMLLPELRRKGYAHDLSMGVIMSAGGLAMMIPPSNVGVVIGALAGLSIAKILIGAIIPGMMMLALYCTWVIARCVLSPAAGPKYEVQTVQWSERIYSTVKYVLPFGFVIFAVTGSIVLGVATPSEASAFGALSSIVLAAFYRRVSWKMLKATVLDTARITVMMFSIVACATGYSQILAFSGATQGLINFVSTLELSPMTLVVCMQGLIFLLGFPMDSISMLLITIPIFFPIIVSLGLDPIWFALLLLINIETAVISPPHGSLLFLMKGIAPPGTTFRDVYAAALPFCVINCLVMAILIIFPQIIPGFLGLFFD